MGSFSKIELQKENMNWFYWILLIVFLSYLFLVLIRRWTFIGFDCRKNFLKYFKGKTIVITGATDGLGLEYAKTAAKYGAKEIILPCRNARKGKVAKKLIERCSSSTEVTIMKMDLLNLVSVKEFVSGIVDREIDLLINNAGIMACPHNTSESGIEIQFSTNHLGHFYLTNLLLPKLISKESEVRVVNVSSYGHKFCDALLTEKELKTPMKSKSRFWLYGHSKMCNILFTRELSKRYSDHKNISFYSLHPGGIPQTNLSHGLVPCKIIRVILSPLFLVLAYPFFKTLWEGIQTHLFVSTAPLKMLKNGGYYDMTTNMPKLKKIVKSEENSRKLWGMSLDLAEEIMEREDED